LVASHSSSALQCSDSYAVPVVLGRRNQPDEGELLPLEPIDGLAQAGVALAGSRPIERPRPPERLSDGEIAAVTDGGRERSERSLETLPDESGAEAGGDVEAFRLEPESACVCLDHLDAVGEPGFRDPLASDLDELGRALDSHDRAVR